MKRYIRGRWFKHSSHESGTVRQGEGREAATTALATTAAPNASHEGGPFVEVLTFEKEMLLFRAC